jgi:hypothetical protein
MTQLPRRVRGILIAVAILALSAGAAVARPPADMPEAAADGLERAGDESGVSVPVAGPPDELGPEAAPTVEPTEESAELPIADPPEAPEPVAEAAQQPENHGAAVSVAAQSETPAEFDNHGQYVRSVATDNHGQDPERATGKERAEQVKPTR